MFARPLNQTVVVLNVLELNSGGQNIVNQKAKARDQLGKCVRGTRGIAVRKRNKDIDSATASPLVIKRGRRTKIETDVSETDYISEGEAKRKLKGKAKMVENELSPKIFEIESGEKDDADIKKPIMNVGNRPLNTFGDAVVPKKETYYRSNVKTIIKELNGLKFKEGHLKLLKLTPFWILSDALRQGGAVKMMKSCHKFEEDIMKIIRTFDFQSECFFIGDKRVPLVNSDAALVFGISYGETPIKLRQDLYVVPKWVKRIFKEELETRKGYIVLLKVLLLKKLRLALSRKDQESFVDVARLVHCYLLDGLLSPNLNGEVSFHMSTYVENFEEICKFNWSTYVVDILKTHIRSSNQMRAGGCAILLPYWLCEHTNLVEPKDPKSFSRFMKWKTVEVHKVIQRIRLSRIEQVRIHPLKPTKLERGQFLDMDILRESEFKKGLGAKKYSGLSSKKPEEFGSTSNEDDTPKIDNQCMSSGKCTKTDDSMTKKSQSDGFFCSPQNFYSGCSTGVPKKKLESFFDVEIPSFSLNMTQTFSPMKQPEIVINSVIGDLNKMFNVGAVDKPFADLEELRKEMASKQTDFDEELRRKEDCILQLRASKDDFMKKLEESALTHCKALEDVISSKDKEFAAELGRKEHCILQLCTEKEELMKKLKESAVEHGTNDEEKEEVFNVVDCGAVENGEDAKLTVLSDNVEQVYNNPEKAEPVLNTPDLENGMVEPASDFGAMIVTQIYDDPISLAQLDAIEKEHVEKMSGEKTKKLVQTSMVTCLKKPSHPLPSSLTLRVKERSDIGGRKAIEFSPQPKTAELMEIVEIDDEEEADGGLVIEVYKLKWDPASPAFKKTDIECRQKIEHYLGLGGKGYLIWKGSEPLAEITVENLIKIVNNKQIAGNVIDAWAEMVHRINAFEYPEASRTTVFTSSCWGLIKGIGNQKFLFGLIDKRLKDSLCMDYLVFPMIARGGGIATRRLGDHWTVLRLDMNKGEWKFYNSLLPRVGCLVDPHLTQTLIVVRYVHKKLRELYKEHRPAHPFLMKSLVLPTSHESVQQMEGTLDCGVVVCSLVEKFILQKTVRKGSFSINTAAIYRGRMVKTFLDYDINDGEKTD